MNNILLISDLDGTLLDKSQRISPENEQAIRRFQQQGGLFTLATGRIEQSVAPFVSQLGIRLPVILYNGAKIYDFAAGKALYEKRLHIPESLWTDIVSQLGDDIALLVYTDGDVFALERNALLEKHERKDKVDCKPMERSALPDSVTKLMFISSSPQLLSRIEQNVAGSGIGCETVYSESNYLEVLPEGVSKGTALRELTRLLKRGDIYTVAAGDNLNDYTLLEDADRGYAVQNAHPKLKEAADALAVHHEQHAIAYIIGQLMGAAIDELA